MTPRGADSQCPTSVARRQSSGSQLHPTRLPPPRPAQHERIAHELGSRKQTRPAAIHAPRTAHLEHRSAPPPQLETGTPNSATGARTRHRTPKSHVLTRRKLRDQDTETTGSSSNRRSHKGSHRQARTPRQGTKLIRLAPASRVATRDAKRGSTVRPFVGRSPLEGVWRSYALDGRRNTKRAGGEAKTQRHKQADNPTGKEPTNNASHPSRLFIDAVPAPWSEANKPRTEHHPLMSASLEAPELRNPNHYPKQTLPGLKGTCPQEPGRVWRFSRTTPTFVRRTSDGSASLSDMPKFTVRLDDEETAQLERLTAAVKARYESMALTIPAFHALARETTRSSALRDLLAAWDHGQADTAFNTQNDTDTQSKESNA